MLDSLEQLRKNVDRYTVMASGEGGRETVWITKSALLDDLDAVVREVEERYVELPKDADGEYVHIGDVMDCGEHFGIQEVEGFIHGAVAFTVCDPQPARICTCPAHMTHHYHEPTIEDVLRNFAEKITDSQIPGVRPTYEEAIAEYAVKLQLKKERDDG